MTVRVVHWEAFANEPGRGNPAGVVLRADGLREEEMQEVARQVGFNETAFVLPSEVAEVRLRYFTPGHEVDLCGHATVASMLARQAEQEGPMGKVRIETRAGVLEVMLSRGPDGRVWVVMEQARAKFAEFGGDLNALAEALGVGAGDIAMEWPVIYGSTGLWTLVVPIRTLDAMRRMRPRNDLFPGILREMPRVSVHPFCLETVDPSARMHARHFSSPYSGTVEDPVTGTASGVLGAYHDKFIAKNGKQPFFVEQGMEVGRDGRVQVWVKPREESYEVSIGGTGCFVQEALVELGG